MSADSSKPVVAAEPRRLPWGPLAAVLMVLFGFIAIPVAAGVLITFIPHLLGWNSIKGDQWLMDSPLSNFLYVLLAESMTLGALAWFFAYKKIHFREAVALQRFRGRDVAYALLGWLAYLVLFVVLLAVIKQFIPINTEQEQAIGFDKGITGVGLGLAFVSLVILPPVAEEIIFRGFFYGTLRSSRVPFIAATILTSIVFASLHLLGAANGGLLWIAFIDTFILSLVLCYVRERTGSIWACIGIHALKNGFVFVNLFLLSK
jgi:membrane protease YdiL (CAAX protease family)